MEWQVAPLDTLFFRGPEPFTAGDSVFLRSLFPPTPQTIQGLIRSALLESHCRNLDLFGTRQCERCVAFERCDVRTVVGTPADGAGPIVSRGPYLLKRDDDGTLTRLYPAPGDLRIASGQVFRCAPGRPVRCDPGDICLPELAQQAKDVKPHVSDWITEDGLRRYREGKCPHPEQLLATDCLVSFEPRVGIGRNVLTHAVREHLLYSIEMVRLHEGIQLGFCVENVPAAMEMDAVAVSRFGGEGRLVSITRTKGGPAFGESTSVIGAVRRSNRFRLVLLSPADFGGGWLPPSFKVEQTDAGFICWTGELGGVGLRIYVSCGGAPYPIGGWDMATRRPKPLRWCVPAGTVYYCEVLSNADALGALDGAKVPDGALGGFGWAILATWNEQFDAGEVTP